MARPGVLDLNRRDLFRGAFTAGALQASAVSASQAPPPAGRPNVLLLMADQLIPHLTGVYGNPLVKTPNLQRLASRGVRFNCAYTPHPLCAPARAALMTGRLTTDIGVYDNAAPLSCDHPTMGHYLTGAGYDTAIAGKMHFVGPDQHHGFRHRISSDIYPPDFEWTKPRDIKTPGAHARGYLGSAVRIIEPDAPVRTHPRTLVCDEEAHKASLEYLKARAADKAPFFLTTSYNHPHEPYLPLRAFWDMYEGVKIPIPEYPPDLEARWSAMDRWLIAHHACDKFNVREPASLARLHRAYYAMVTYMDSKVGEILDALEKHGLAGNTAVIFTADHGDMLCQKGMVQKRCFYEWSARIPMILAMPDGRGAAKTVDTPVSLLDVFPTVLDVAGVQPDRRLPPEGRSLLGHLTGEARPDRAVFSEQHSEGVNTTCFMVRRGRYKYVHIHNYDAQLFDLERDPDEWENLAGRTDYRGVQQEMAALLFNRFDPQAIERDLRGSLARRELIREAMKTSKPDWNFKTEPVA